MLKRSHVVKLPFYLLVAAALALGCLGIAWGAVPALQGAFAPEDAQTETHLISNAADLKQLADDVNGGDNKSGQIYKLTSDIDLSSYETWESIGSSRYRTFQGTFDGDGYTISGLTINSNTGRNGLFGGARNATFKNLTLKGTMTVGGGNGALLAVTNGGCTFTNIASYVDIVSLSTAGMVGECSPSTGAQPDVFTNCVNHGNISVVGNSGLFANVGGICGMGQDAIFKNCYNTGTISVNSGAQQSRAGGIAGGYGTATFVNCYNVGKISGPDDNFGAISWNSDNVAGDSANNYYDSETSGCNGAGKTASDPDSISAKTTSEMKSAEILALLNATGSEFVADTAGVNDSYPVLRFEAETGAPIITVNPAAELNLVQGTTAEPISVEASCPAAGSKGADGTLSYQWYASQTDSCNPLSDQPVANATSSSFVPPSDTSGIAYYYCVVMNTFSGKTVSSISTPCKVTVVSSVEAAAPIISQQPLSATFKEGLRTPSLSIEAAVEGAGAGTISYQWFATQTGLVADGVAIVGETSDYLSLGSLDLGTYYYYCVVTNTFEDVKTATATSDVAAVTIAPMTIGTVDEYNEFARAVNAGNDFSGITVSLVDDIDFTGSDMEMVGYYRVTSYSTKRSFGGTFDGQGHALTNIHIENHDSVAGRNVGLFGYTVNGMIENLTVTGSVSGNAYVGGIAGRCEKTRIESVSVDVAVEATSQIAGGICGYYYGFDDLGCAIQSCVNRGSVTSNGETAGGIAGKIDGVTVRNCYNRGAVKASIQAGGIVASGSSLFVKNCYNAASVSLFDSSNNNEFGAIIAIQPGGFDDPATALVGNYYDSNLCPRGITVVPTRPNASYDYSVSAIISRTTDEMKKAEFVETLGDSYRADNTFSNNGYPILAFENVKWTGAIDVDWYNRTDDTFTLSKPAQLAGLAAIVNGTASGTPRDSFAQKTIVLANDIYLNADGDESMTGWTPIGTSAAPFCGTFDGAGHTVHNISIAEGAFAASGLFGVIDRGAFIENIGVTGKISSEGYAGGIAGCVTNGVAGADPVIQNCWNGAEVSSTGYHATRGAGGILGGDTYATIPATYSIIDCYNVGIVHARKAAGGIAGVNSGLIMNCYSAADVSSDAGSGYAGAITATNKQRNAFIVNCYYLEGSAPEGVSYSEDAPSAQVAAKSADELRASDMPEALGESFCRDVANVNGGWPILLYQAPDDIKFLSDCSVSVDSAVYSGLECTPSVTVTGSDGEELALGTDYSIASYENNINAGTAWVKLVGEGMYTGSRIVDFTIEKAPLSARYVSETIELGARPNMAVQVSGFVNGETSDTAAGYVAPAAVAPSPMSIGEFEIIPQGGEADNYTFEYVAGTLTVEDPAKVPTFSDVTADHWLMREPSGNPGEYLTFVVKNGIMTGYVNTDLFGPDDCITREQVATILFRASNPDSFATTDPAHYGTSTTFSDVEVGRYSTAAIEWCKEQGIISGYDGTSAFGPQDNVTREQLCKMLAEYARVNGEIIANPNMDAFNRIPGHDGTTFPGADLYMAWCVNEGVIGGVQLPGGPNLMPTDTATRAEMAKMATVVLRDVIGA